MSRSISSDVGRYEFPFLAPGAYTLAAAKPGFRKAVREGIVLQVAERAELDLTLVLAISTKA